MKMGSTEKAVLKEARDSEFVNSKSGQGPLFRRMVEKGWLERIDYGQFRITEKGEEDLEERIEEGEVEDQQSIGDFS